MCIDFVKEKQRLVGLYSIVLFSGIAIASSYFGWGSFNALFDYENIMVFSRFDVFLMTGPAFLFCMVILGGYVLVTGKQAPLHIQKRWSYSMILGFVVSLLSNTVFMIYYSGSLEEKGYIRCSGTPLGYMPAMGVKYVIEPELCNNKYKY